VPSRALSWLTMRSSDLLASFSVCDKALADEQHLLHICRTSLLMIEKRGLFAFSEEFCSVYYVAESAV